MNQGNKIGNLQKYVCPCFYRVIAHLLLIMLLFCGIPQTAIAVPSVNQTLTTSELKASLQVGQYQKISSSRFNNILYDFTFKAQITNSGNHNFNLVRASLRSLTSATTVVDGDLLFGALGAYQAISSQDTFTIRQDRTKVFNPADLAWDVQFNTPPVANAGFNQTLHVGDLAQLNGSGSTDIDGDSLKYAWRFLAIPSGSHAILTNPGSVNPNYTIDRPGNYQIGLVVNDGVTDSTTSDEAHTLLRALYQTKADLLPDLENQTLTIQLHHLANVMSDKVIEKLCDELNATETRFPRTNMRMIFNVGSI